jgi:hypothetical protein
MSMLNQAGGMRSKDSTEKIALHNACGLHVERKPRLRPWDLRGHKQSARALFCRAAGRTKLLGTRTQWIGDIRQTAFRISRRASIAQRNGRCTA